MKRNLLFALLILSFESIYSQNIYRFDLGNPDIAAHEETTPVGPTEKYDKAIGFGWLELPDDLFASDPGPLTTGVIQDGIQMTTPCSFRIDVPQGEYFLKITGGNGSRDTSQCMISINGQILDDTIQSPFFRLSYRHFKKEIAVNRDSLILKFIPLSQKTGIHAIELHPITEPFSIPNLDPRGLETDTAIVGNFYRTLSKQLQENPQDPRIQLNKDLLETYLQAAYFYDIGWWSWAVEETGLSVFDRFHAASDWLEQFLSHPDHPLYDRAIFLIGRIHYWLYKEQGDENNLIRYKKYFKKLESKYPDHEILGMYTGVKVPYTIENDIDTTGAPLWAIRQQEAISRMLHIIHWWVDSVQADNGELGGKYGDDVEILRWWLPAVLGTDDDKARLGYQRLADGVWNSGQLEQGYSRKLEDVEHAAELIRDSHPVMLILRYGDPEYVERCMIGMQHLGEVWTGITPEGNRHFKSSYFSATEILSDPPYGVDVPMNARATLTGLWATWYNHNPELIKLFSEWGYAWTEASQSTDKDKPRWIFPAAVRFDNNEIGGYADNWYHPDLGWEYYNWEHLGGSEEMYHQMLGMFHITGDSTLLLPFQNMLELVKKYSDKENEQTGPVGSESWAAHQLRSEPELLGFALNLGLDQYSSLIEDQGSPYAKYLLTQEMSHVDQGLDQVLNSLRYNLPLFTTEVKFTDRVYVPGHDLLSGMYTGHVGSGFEFPFLHVSWENTKNEVGVLVGNCDETSLNVTLHSFVNDKELGMKVWRLTNGIYRIKVISKDDQSIITTFNDTIDERGQMINLKFPQKGTYKIQMELLEESEPSLFPRGDLAIGDVKFNTYSNMSQTLMVQLEVDIHNIGNQAIEGIDIDILSDGQLLARKQLDVIGAPNDLVPVKHTVIFTDLNLLPTAKEIQVKVSTQKGKEITYFNNRKIVDLSIQGK